MKSIAWLMSLRSEGTVNQRLGLRVFLVDPEVEIHTPSTVPGRLI
jgi:hypothetical protein